MNPEAQQMLDEILRKNPEDLTEDEVKFLRARRGYLEPWHEEKFEKVLAVSLTPTIELESLKAEAKSLGIKGAHLYKDADKLQKVIKETRG